MPLYSVWLELRAAQRDTVLELTEYVFEEIHDAMQLMPHVTVIGAFEMREDDALAAFDRLVNDPAVPREPFALEEISGKGTTLGPVDTDGHHLPFRCAYRLYQKDARVMETFHAAKRAFADDTPAATYEPHLSLAYGVVDSAQREWIRASSNEYFDRKGLSSGIEIAAISLWNTELFKETGHWNTTEYWNRVATRDLDAKV